ncbi:MAG: AMP-binding protein [Verrucomicrobia bacterium]|nr:AMP-binding protein [Verrucomicrobiota bacterium]
MSAVAVFHADHAAHLREALRAHDAGLPVFLGNPHWVGADRDEAARQIPRGTTLLGADWEPRGLGTCDWPRNWRGRVMIPTGGTGGKVKFVIHSADTLRAAAHGLRDALVARGLSPVLHGVTCTPPWHVSGFLPAVRARVTGGRHVVLDGRFPADAALPGVDLPADGTRIVSLVPTQLTRLLAHASGEAWLRGFPVVLLGGAAVPAPLLAEIRARRLPVFLTYGATETAAACALCPPEKIWAGEAVRGAPLPGVRLATTGEGVITVDAPSLGFGVWPDGPLARPWTSGDRGDVAADGSVRIAGRADRVIVTGGEKVDPARVEQTLLATGLVSEALVIGLADATWGEVVTACVVGEPAAEAALRQACEGLEPAARPRRYVFVPSMPTNASGKPDRAAIAKLTA